MVIILDEIREMIAMPGGDSSKVNDISEGLVTLKRLMKANQAPKSTVEETPEESFEDFAPRKSRKK